jgi:hypothetical protein
MTFGFIYKIEFPNGKHYIGLTTTSLEQRQTEHNNCAKQVHTKCILYNALKKYDMIDHFKLIQIDTADTLEELYKKEIEYILKYNSYYMNENGYNMTYGGDGTHGYIFTEEDNKKNSEAQKKYYKENPQATNNHSERLKKYYSNPEALKKNREALKKYYENNPEARQKCSEAQKKRFENSNEGKEHSAKMKKHFENPESRTNHSDALKKYYSNPEARKKNSEAQKKRFENPEQIQKNSEAQKKRFENPEAKKQVSNTLKKYYENPEARKKNSIIQKKRFENPQEKRKILDIKGKNKPFDIFTIDGIYIKTFNYQFESREFLQKEYNIHSTINISDVLSGKRNYSAGFVFKYK